jgi:hypothetical protein
VLNIFWDFRVSNHCWAFQVYFDFQNFHLTTQLPCGLSDLLLVAIGSLVVFVLQEYILKVHIPVSSEHIGYNGCFSAFVLR